MPKILLANALKLVGHEDRYNTIRRFDGRLVVVFSLECC
jgi:hypothetical protein